MADDDEHWIDVSVLGSQYEEQVSTTTGQRRHRERGLGPLADPDYGTRFDILWKSGPAPTSQRKCRFSAGGKCPHLLERDCLCKNLEKLGIGKV